MVDCIYFSGYINFFLDIVQIVKINIKGIHRLQNDFINLLGCNLNCQTQR